MRIWHQSMTELDGLGVYQQSLEVHSKQVLGPDCQVDFFGMPSGRYKGKSPSEALKNAYVHHCALEPVLENVIKAESGGYAAFVVGSFSEPFLRELRSAVDIPVVSLPEASLLVGCSLGRYCAHVSAGPAGLWLTRLAMESHGLTSRVLPGRVIDPPLDDRTIAECFTNPTPVVESFTKAALGAIEQGADVIIPAEGLLAELLHSQGIKRLAGALVMDVCGVTWAYAKMLAELQLKTRLSVGRAWHYYRNDVDYVHSFAPKTTV